MGLEWWKGAGRAEAGVSPTDPPDDLEQVLEESIKKLKRLRASFSEDAAAFAGGVRRFVFAQNRDRLRSPDLSNEITSQIYGFEGGIVNNFSWVAEDVYTRLCSYLEVEYVGLKYDLVRFRIRSVMSSKLRMALCSFSAIALSLWQPVVSTVGSHFLARCALVLAVICGLNVALPVLFDHLKCRMPARKALDTAVQCAQAVPHQLNANRGAPPSMGPVYGQGLTQGIRTSIWTSNPMGIVAGLGLAAAFHLVSKAWDAFFGPTQKELAEGVWSNVECVLSGRQRELVGQLEARVDELIRLLPTIAHERQMELLDFRLRAEALMRGEP